MGPAVRVSLGIRGRRPRLGRTVMITDKFMHMIMINY